MRAFVSVVLLVLAGALAGVDGAVRWKCGPCRCIVSRSETTAYCQDKQLKQIPKELPSNLTSLFLQDNYLRSSARLNERLNQFKQLTQLKLFSNKLTSIPQLGLPALKKLELAKNSIERITTPINLSQLEELDLSNNMLLQVHPAAFQSLNSLQSLLLRQNKLSTFNLDIVPAAHLVTLDLSHNQLQRIKCGEGSNFPVLESVDISENKLGSQAYRISSDAFGFINSMPALASLGLNSNNLERLPLHLEKVGQMNRLSVDASKNEIEWLSKADLGPGSAILEELDLRNNRLKGVQNQAFADMDKNMNVYLSDNKWSCAQSKYVYEWVAERTQRSRFVSSNSGFNRDLKCLPATGEATPMSAEAVDEPISDAISVQVDRPVGMVSAALNLREREQPDYATWNVSLMTLTTVKGAVVSEGKVVNHKVLSNRQQFVTMDKPQYGPFKVCYQFSERVNEQCEEFEGDVRPVTPAVEEPSFLDEETMTYLIFAMVCGVFLCLFLLAGAVCYRTAAKKKQHKASETNYQKEESRQEFLAPGSKTWGQVHPITASRQNPTNFGTMHPTLHASTATRTHNRRHVEDARAEFDYTHVNNSGDMIRPGGFGTNPYTQYVRTQQVGGHHDGVVGSQSQFFVQTPRNQSPSFRVCTMVGGAPCHSPTRNPEDLSFQARTVGLDSGCHSRGGSVGEQRLGQSIHHASPGANQSTEFKPQQAGTESSHLSDEVSDYV